VYVCAANTWFPTGVTQPPAHCTMLVHGLVSLHSRRATLSLQGDGGVTPFEILLFPVGLVLQYAGKQTRRTTAAWGRGRHWSVRHYWASCLLHGHTGLISKWNEHVYSSKKRQNDKKTRKQIEQYQLCATISTKLLVYSTDSRMSWTEHVVQAIIRRITITVI